MRFEKIHIDNVAFEAASAADINQDGRLDIVCGENWYEAPNWTRHHMCEVQPEGEYYDDFSDIPMDVNGDGYPDIVTGGWFGETLYWRENPRGKPGPWTVHSVARIGNIETTRAWDVDGCGELEIVPNTPPNDQVFFKLNKGPDGRGNGTFSMYTAMKGPTGHGHGFGDIDGDGRGEIILSGGWLEPSDDPLSGLWTFHDEFSLGAASNPILVHDVNGDGLADLIVGHAHGYGLHWWEQSKDADGRRTWTQHVIDMTCAQYHDMQLADIDNDGELELVTGKRYRAHCGNDPGDNDPVGVYYFKIRGGEFERHIIDWGPADQGGSGVGIYFWVEDIDGDGLLDIIAPGKEGLYLFRNLGD